MKLKKTGFTIVELMTAVAIIAMLIAILIPAIAMVRKIAKETQQKAQLTTIDLALTAFKGDFGDYPDSGPERDDWGVYTGAQKLAEALMGQDLLGFHEDSIFQSNLSDESGVELYPYDLDPTRPEGQENLDARRGPYLELATANAFWLGKTSGTREHDGLFEDTFGLREDTYVLCDVFGVKKITFEDGESAKAGTPILYYKANPSCKTMEVPANPRDPQIYQVYDNMPLVALGKLPEPDPDRDPHKLADKAVFYSEEYRILDPKVTATKDKVRWPHRPDSYILISAGADGEYGTSDDIFNF